MSHPPDQAIQRYWTMSRDDLSGYWFDAYGWIACYFAQLEGLSYALIESLGTTEDKARLLRLPYQARADRAKALVIEHVKARGNEELAEQWSMFIDEAKAAAPMRNKILHNPLTVSLASGDPLHDVDVGIVLTHEPDRPVMKLGTVQAFSKIMLDLNRRMQHLLAQSGLSK